MLDKHMLDKHDMFMPGMVPEMALRHRAVLSAPQSSDKIDTAQAWVASCL